jgi:hypothetical protein
LTAITKNDHDMRDELTFVFHETIVRKVLVLIFGIFFKAFMVLKIEGLDNLPGQGVCVGCKPSV